MLHPDLTRRTRRRFWGRRRSGTLRPSKNFLCHRSLIYQGSLFFLLCITISRLPSNKERRCIILIIIHTLGLDVQAKRVISKFLKWKNREEIYTARSILICQPWRANVIESYFPTMREHNHFFELRALDFSSKTHSVEDDENRALKHIWGWHITSSQELSSFWIDRHRQLSSILVGKPKKHLAEIN